MPSCEGELGGMMDVIGRIIRGGGCHPCPAWGAPDDGFDQFSQGHVGGGQGGAVQVSY